MNRRNLIILAGALALVLLLLVGWIINARTGGLWSGRSAALATATNPALDIRYSYDPHVFSLPEYDERGEYPLQLDAEGWSLHGKRISGLGRIIGDSPAPILYDFVASQHAEMYEEWFKLERTREEYEDATIQGRLGIHCSWTYQRTPETITLPPYLPEAARSGDMLEMESWSLFTENDLFFFYTFSSEQLTEAQRSAVLEVLESIQFNVLGTLPGPARIPRGSGRSETEGNTEGATAP